MVSANPIMIPLTFPMLGSGSDAVSKDPVEVSLSSACPTCLTVWAPNAEGCATGRPSHSQGIAIGCEDGTVYILQTIPLSKRRFSESSPTFPLEVTSPSRGTSPLRYPGLGGSTSRSASPSSNKSNSSPFHVSRSRIVSSVSTEQVEAPKNYVDFDEEPDKLKGMLMGRGVKEKSHGDSLSPNVDRSNVSEKCSRSPSKHRPRALSPASSVKSLLSPPSPLSQSFLPVTVSQDMNEVAPVSLKYHFFPSRFGYLHPIIAMQPYDADHIVCLQQTGCITILTTVDGTCAASTSVDQNGVLTSHSDSLSKAPATWIWKSLSVFRSEKTNIIFACASRNVVHASGYSSDPSEDASEDQSRISMFEIRVGWGDDLAELSIQKIEDWCVDGRVDSVGFLQEVYADSFTLFHVSSLRRLTLQTLSFVNTPSPAESPIPDQGSNTTLPLPNPFKALQALSRERVSETEGCTQTPGRVLFGEELDIGEIAVDGPILGVRTVSLGTVARAVFWSGSEFSAYEFGSRTLRRLFAYSLTGIRDIQWTETDCCLVVLQDRAEIYRLVESDPIHNASLVEAVPGARRTVQPCLMDSFPMPFFDLFCIAGGKSIVCTGTKGNKRRIQCISFDTAGEYPRQRTLWKSSEEPFDTVPRTTSMLPIDLDRIILGYSDGRLRRSSFPQMVQKPGNFPIKETSDIPLAGPIVGLHVIVHERTKGSYIVGGVDDGSIAIWALDSLRLLARWTVFIAPLAQVIYLSDEKVGRLRDCVLCISQDGTIAVIAVDGFQFVYLIPASTAPLKRVCMGADNLLLTYTDSKARLWDTKTLEFWRSMSVDKADEMLDQGEWTEWPVECDLPTTRGILSTLTHTPAIDSASTLILDVEALLRQCTATHPVTGSKISTSHAFELAHVRSILSVLLPLGLNHGIDEICREKLGVETSRVFAGMTSNGSYALYPEHAPRCMWNISPKISALHALALLAIMQILTHYEDLMQDANTVMMFYAASLPGIVGPSYQPPSLPVLARHWLLSTVVEVRHASRVLFDAEVMRLPDEEVPQLIAYWKHFLPVLRTRGEKSALRNATALFICGFTAVEKYTLLAPSILTDISKSVALYLHDEISPFRSLAIDLCSHGFPVWQQYVDAVEMLRALFTLATTSRKETISPHNTAAQARTAVLQIVSSNTPLFMTTLTIDILHPQTVQHRKSVMQLVIFLIRKNPLALYSNLPRLLEAVVKSLDPNSTASREAVLDSATEILGHVVRTFPTVDFHMTTQRLAVGTSEGAVVMYDLKTATRLYVLEGHKKRTTACSFSPDGRRLVTVSLEESVALVWKVGSSFTSFFNPGAPPRQGHGGSEPFRRLSFNVGEEAFMTLASTLDHVRFEWTAERSVKLRIRDSIFTFST